MPYNSGVSQNGSIGLYSFDASTRRRAALVIIIMPRSLKPRNFPCPVQGCKFLATGSRGLSLHSRIHRDELRALRRREKARHRELLARHETGNADDIGDNGLNDAGDGNTGFHDNHENRGMDGNASANEDDCPQLSNNSNKTPLSAAERIEYHPFINGT